MKIGSVHWNDIDPAVTPAREPDWWLLDRPWDFYVDGRKHTVPAGYRTDFSSIPKFTPVTRAWLWGRSRRSALTHDFLYTSRGDGAADGRAYADAVFREALKTEGVNWFARDVVLYGAVHLFGGGVYNRRGTDDEQRLPSQDPGSYVGGG